MMPKKTILPLLILSGLFAAVVTGMRPAEQGEPARKTKTGWVETVKLDMHGWTVHADTRLVTGDHKKLGTRALSMLANHLERIAILMPEKQLAELRTMEIFIEHSHPELASMQYHPGVDWLNERGYDPLLVKKVHIPQAAELVSRDQLLKHPAVILHELAHAYHDQTLGFEDPSVIHAYEEAMKKGIYEKSLLYTGDIVKHYATTNHKEYFAEATEAYLYHNDFYPFVRAELRAHDPVAFALMEKVWGKTK
jgi:dipeptidyl-peptidase-4